MFTLLITCHGDVAGNKFLANNASSARVVVTVEAAVVCIACQLTLDFCFVADVILSNFGIGEAAIAVCRATTLSSAMKKFCLR